jgi:hypothetical protein
MANAVLFWGLVAPTVAYRLASVTRLIRSSASRSAATRWPCWCCSRFALMRAVDRELHDGKDARRVTAAARRS